MSRFRHVELQYASRLLNHGPTILITSYDAPSDRRNVMAAHGQCRWNSPPRVAIVVDKSTRTREIIERNGTFGIVVPGVAAASWTYAVGSVSGRDEDKFNAGIGSNRSELGLPLIEEKCLAWMECRLPPTAAQTQYDTCSGRWSLPPPMSARSSPDAGNSMTISSIPCIILAPAILSPAAVMCGQIPSTNKVTCRGRRFPLPGLRPPLTRRAAAIGAGVRPNTFYTGW